MYRLWIHHKRCGDMAARAAVVANAYKIVTSTTAASCFYCDDLKADVEFCFVICTVEAAMDAGAALTECGYAVSCPQATRLHELARVIDPHVDPAVYEQYRRPDEESSGLFNGVTELYLYRYMCWDAGPPEPTAQPTLWLGRPRWQPPGTLPSPPMALQRSRDVDMTSVVAATGAAAALAFQQRAAVPQADKSAAVRGITISDAHVCDESDDSAIVAHSACAGADGSPACAPGAVAESDRDCVYFTPPRQRAESTVSMSTASLSSSSSSGSSASRSCDEPESHADVAAPLMVRVRARRPRTLNLPRHPSTVCEICKLYQSECKCVFGITFYCLPGTMQRRFKFRKPFPPHPNFSVLFPDGIPRVRGLFEC